MSSPTLDTAGVPPVTTEGTFPAPLPTSSSPRSPSRRHRPVLHAPSTRLYKKIKLTVLDDCFLLQEYTTFPLTKLHLTFRHAAAASAAASSSSSSTSTSLSSLNAFSSTVVTPLLSHASNNNNNNASTHSTTTTTTADTPDAREEVQEGACEQDGQQQHQQPNYQQQQQQRHHQQHLSVQEHQLKNQTDTNPLAPGTNCVPPSVIAKIQFELVEVAPSASSESTALGAGTNEPPMSSRESTDKEPSIQADSTSPSPPTKPRRVSVVSVEQASEMTGGKEYVVDGCIGLVELHADTFLILIAAGNDLGKIEDKAVYGIKKVIILPLHATQACEILDRQKLSLQAFIDAHTVAPETSFSESDSPPLLAALGLDSLTAAGLASATLSPPATPPPIEITASSAPTSSGVTSPKLRFSLFDRRKSTNSALLSSSNQPSRSSSWSSLGGTSVSEAGESTAGASKVVSNSKRVSFDDAAASRPKKPFFKTPSIVISPSANPFRISTAAKGKDGINNEDDDVVPIDGETEAPSSPPLSPFSPASFPAFFAKFKDSFALDKEKDKDSDKKQLAATSAPATKAEADVEQNDSGVTSTEIKDASPTTTATSDAPPTSSSSTSATQTLSSSLDAAETFIANTAKQLSTWGAGILRNGESEDGSAEKRHHLIGGEASDSSQLLDEIRVEDNTGTENLLDEMEELERNQNLDRKIVREMASIFNTGFYYSYEFNLLTSMQKRTEQDLKDAEYEALDKLANREETTRHHEHGGGGGRGMLLARPLWQQVDKRFWWNQHLLQEFIELDLHGFILPVMQGYVEIAPCEIESQAFDFVLISRRSRLRSGLRYQRRGIDPQGHTANFVETEQLLRIVRQEAESDHQVSFLQSRGSIPIFWSQSPYRLKPIPILERSERENSEGFGKHFEEQKRFYGNQVLINLVEQHGREMIAGSAYRKYATLMNDPNVKYIEFDFHHECKGMKYENIDVLIKKLEAYFQDFGYCWVAPLTGTFSPDATNSHIINNTKKVNIKNKILPASPSSTSLVINPIPTPVQLLQVLHEQKGIIRTNCMDCLDRTNVVQSAIGRHVLNMQLLRLGISSFPDKGISVYEQFENVFNNVWANNGDMISRVYAGTSALKGEFVRSGKTSFEGMLKDGASSLARLYQNVFKDHFRQANIDYLLGHQPLQVFKDLQSTPFGTAVVPAPILPVEEVEDVAATEAVLDTTTTEAVGENNDTVGTAEAESVTIVVENAKAEVAAAVEVTASATVAATSEPVVEVAEGAPTPATETDTSVEHSELEIKSQERWTLVREAAIETSAEIVLSPGEVAWQGWTLVCRSNEIGGALSSSSSSSSTVSSTSSKKVINRKSEDDGQDDEKVVLLTDRALYVCTYDYEMEKVSEFWRLALEQLVRVDVGPLAADKDSMFGFILSFKERIGGEIMRVNSGSVRNRRRMLTHGDDEEGLKSNLAVLTADQIRRATSSLPQRGILGQLFSGIRQPSGASFAPLHQSSQQQKKTDDSTKNKEDQPQLLSENLDKDGNSASATLPTAADSKTTSIASPTEQELSHAASFLSSSHSSSAAGMQQPLRTIRFKIVQNTATGHVPEAHSDSKGHRTTTDSSSIVGGEAAATEMVTKIGSSYKALVAKISLNSIDEGDEIARVEASGGGHGRSISEELQPPPSGRDYASELEVRFQPLYSSAVPTALGQDKVVEGKEKKSGGLFRGFGNSKKKDTKEK